MMTEDEVHLQLGIHLQLESGAYILTLQKAKIWS